MSRTRKTRPLHVRMADPKDHAVDIVEIHNHINNRGCDLPENHDPKTIEDSYGSPYWASQEDRPCHYGYFFNGTNVCGCRMCTGHDYRIQENRKERHHTKEKLNEIKKAHDYDGDEI